MDDSARGNHGLALLRLGRGIIHVAKLDRDTVLLAEL